MRRSSPEKVKVRNGDVRRRRKSAESTDITDFDEQKRRFNEIQDMKMRKSISEHYITKDSSGNATSSPLLFAPTIDYKLQFIIVGDRNVGKTCFLERYTDNRFKEELRSTVGIDFRIKTISVAGHQVRLQIWDTAGQERFNSITTAYYRNARGIVMVYDVTRPETYRNLDKWLDLVKEYGRDDVEIAIVGNKADLPDLQVNPHKARHFAEQSGFLFYETSAKESLNIETVFINLVYKILKQIPQPHERNPRIRRKTIPSTIIDDNPHDKEPCRSACC
uniref:Ras-related protein Rab-12 n=1 Tax=Phallusia mammillata TaxID=59560 RepID=A0A6F9DQV6_9ASCI|nr:ras-related protein Rab-12-like [Phallusia mammillata]